MAQLLTTAWAVRSQATCDYFFVQHHDNMGTLWKRTHREFWEMEDAGLVFANLQACREWGSAPPPDLLFFPGHVLTLLRFIFARVTQRPAQTYWTLSGEPRRPCCVCLHLDRQIRLHAFLNQHGFETWCKNITHLPPHHSLALSSSHMFVEEQCYHASRAHPCSCVCLNCSSPL